MIGAAQPLRNPARHVADQSRNLPDLFLNRVRATPQRVAYKHKERGRWIDTTWHGFHDQSSRVASWLITRGIQAGDKVCVVGSTRPEWVLCDMGGQLAGAVTIGAYPTSSPDQLAYIVEHSESKIVFVEGKEEIAKILEIKDRIPGVQCVVVWRRDALGPELAGNALFAVFEDVLDTSADPKAIAERVDAVKPDDTAIIVYTSGTTGPPKGAMISQGNIISYIRGTQGLVPFDADDISLNFLPMAHVAERIAGFYARISAGITAAYASSVPAVLEEVKEVRPTVFGSVPRIFEKAYAKMKGEVAKAPAGKQKVFAKAEAVGREVVRHWQRGEKVPLGLAIQYKLFDKLVFSKIREVFGGRVRNFLTGAAPISYEILEFFWAAGFPIYEVYGMTEATVITHGNRPGDVRLGTVGKAIAPMVEEKLADDGEILIRGATVFKGYYKNPEATAEAIDKDGWLHTGDIGRREPDGSLRIVDRKKHIIITAGGKNITPANIEQDIKGQDALISNVHAHGDRRAYLTALVTIHPMEAIEWARANNLLTDNALADRLVKALMENPLARPEGLDGVMQTVTERPEIRSRIAAAVQRANRSLSRVETIKKVYVLERDFSLEEDEITPTMKIKRKNVEKKFTALFDRLYEDKAFGIVIEDENKGAAVSI